MTRAVEVHNLMNGQTVVFMDCLPSEAVVRAYLMSIGRNNTWDWEREYQCLYPTLIWGKRSVACGNWTALTTPTSAGDP